MTGPSHTAVLAEALGSRYELMGEVAQGGMATIHRGIELPGERPVAVKVMRPSVATAIGRKRFEREIRIAASLSHPLIVPLLDSGEAGGLLYYIMPFVEGETLRGRLSRDRRLPCAEALAIGRDLAEALGYAHGRGVLHRDVKPENVLLFQGHALVADFGLARAIGAIDTTQLTASGTSVGTIEYMSPEQILAEDPLDERTDIYGLGCVLFEALSGEPPFSAPSLHELVRRIMSALPPRVRAFRIDVPVEVDEQIARALAKEPERRQARMSELSAALRQPPN